MVTNKNIHLLFSSILLTIVSFGYGFGYQIADVFSFSVTSVDLENIFKAIMGLYLAMAGFWLYGVINPNYWKAATLVNILFMLGLAVGRTVSILLDGIPSDLWILGTIGEFVIGFWGIYNLRKYKSSSN